MTAPLSGDIIFAADTALGWKAGTVIARGRRTTNSATTTSEVGVLRLDDVPLVGGRLYWIGTNAVALDTGNTADSARCNLRYTTDGSTPTTSSTALAMGQAKPVDAAVAETVSVSAFYIPASDETFSVLLTVQRATGTTAAVGLTGGTGQPSPIDLFIQDCGVDPGDTGTDI